MKKRKQKTGDCSKHTPDNPVAKNSTGSVEERKKTDPHVYMLKNRRPGGAQTALTRQTQEQRVRKGGGEAVNHSRLTSVVAAAPLWLPCFSGVTLASYLQEALITM